jgi:hypothetical protein
MKSLLFIFVGLFCTQIYSQSFSIDELIILSSSTVEDRERIISQKGFSYKDSEDRGYKKSITFENKSKNVKVTITFESDNYGINSILWTTTSSIDFFNIINQIKQKKLSLSSSETYLCNNINVYKISETNSLVLSNMSNKNKGCKYGPLFAIELKYRK